MLWNVFTAVGALAEVRWVDPKQWGLDGAAVAAFLGLLWPRLKGREPWRSPSSAHWQLCWPCRSFRPGVPILIAAVVAAVIGWLSHGRKDEGLEPDIDPYAERHPGHHRQPGHHPGTGPNPEQAWRCPVDLWGWLLLACLFAYEWKLVGYLLPASLLQNPRMFRIAGTMTIGLLASLTIVNTLASGQALALDARLGALAAAAVALIASGAVPRVVLAGPEPRGCSGWPAGTEPAVTELSRLELKLREAVGRSRRELLSDVISRPLLCSKAELSQLP